MRGVGATSQVGADQQLGPGESTAARQLQFNNPASEMFQFTVVVAGHVPDPAGAASGAGGTSGGDAGSSSGSGTSSGTSTTSGTGLVSGVRLQFLVNPLTKSVSVSVLR